MASSPPPTTDEVDMLYYQLTEIHAIGATQLAEYARRWHSSAAPGPFWLRTGRQGSDGTPSVTRTAPPPPTNFFPRIPPWRQGPPSEPLACRQDRQISVQPKRCTRNSHHDELSGWRRSCRNPRGMPAGAAHMEGQFCDLSM
jgi:hypothetical protein